MTPRSRNRTRKTVRQTMSRPMAIGWFNPGTPRKRSKTVGVSKVEKHVFLDPQKPSKLLIKLRFSNTPVRGLEEKT